MDGKKVYVVEDEGITAKQVKSYVEQLGHEVPFMTSAGEEAYEKIVDSPPDLVLMDINLQGSMDGIEATEKLVEETDVPIVYLTAYGDQKTVERARSSGALGLILKPIDRGDIESTMNSIFENGQVDSDEFTGEIFFRWVNELVDGLGEQSLRIPAPTTA